MRPIKRRKKNDGQNRVLLEHEPIEQRSLLTPMRQFTSTPDAETTEALSFLASWYNSDHYAGLEHERGRDSNISGRHMLQTPYGRSRMGQRDEPYQRAVDTVYSGRLNPRAKLNLNSYGEYLPYDETVNINRNRYGDYKTGATVHELYHSAEGVLNPDAIDPQGELRGSSSDRRFIDPEFVNNREAIFLSADSMDRLSSSNPYSPNQWASDMFGDESDYFYNSFAQYVNQPSEITARLREAAWEAQNAGLLPRGEFRLNDDILNKLVEMEKPNMAASQLLEYVDPERRQKFYNSL